MMPCLECLHIPNPQPISKKIKIKEIHEKALKSHVKFLKENVTKIWKQNLKIDN